MSSHSKTSSTTSSNRPVINEEEDEEQEAQTSIQTQQPQIPYKKIGGFFLALAIVMAILLIAVPESISDDVPYPNRGKVFFAFIGLFIVFLFSCLYCTYYLGGPKDSWDIETNFDGVRWNFSNITALIGLVIEFVQICSFAFNSQIQFTGVDSLRNMTYVALPFTPGHVFRIMFWIMFVISFSPYLFVVSVRIIIYTITRMHGETKSSEFVQKYQQQIYSILWFLVNTLYLPVIGTMMGGIDCTFTSAGVTLDSDPTIHCLSSVHLPYVICSVIALIIYYPAASFAQSQTQSISDIKFKPKIVFIFVQGKVILAAMNIFFSNYPKLYLGVNLSVEISMLFINIYFEPCLELWVNKLQTIFYSISVWTAISAFVALKPGINPNTPLVLLIIGWIVAGVGLPIFFFIIYGVREKVAKVAEKKRESLSSPSSPVV